MRKRYIVRWNGNRYDNEFRAWDRKKKETICELGDRVNAHWIARLLNQWQEGLDNV